MSYDINKFNLQPNQYQQQIKQNDQTKVNVDIEGLAKSLKRIASPVFDFFTKTQEEEPTQENNIFMNYENEIQKYEMKSAKIQRILNDSDPTARKKMNIVI